MSKIDAERQRTIKSRYTLDSPLSFSVNYYSKKYRTLFKEISRVYTIKSISTLDRAVKSMSKNLYFKPV